MAKRGYTDITILLDRSGSMSSRRDDTIGGLKTFVEEQQRLSALLKTNEPDLPGEASLTFCQFDHEFDTVFSALPLPQVKIDPATYVPRGNTALFDAIARCVGNTVTRLGALPKAEQPEKVIFVIITDGQENASREVTGEAVKDLVELQKKAGVEFIFLGANIDAFAAGAQVGMRGAQFTANAAGIGASYGYTSALIGSSRMGSAGRVDADALYGSLCTSGAVDDQNAVRGVAAFQAMVGTPAASSSVLVDATGTPFMVSKKAEPEVLGKKAKRPSKRV